VQRLPDVTDAPTFWGLLGSFSGDLAFDVGANIGQAARVLAPRFARVVSFEPCEESVSVLEAEKPANVEVWPVAVSSVAGEVELDECASSIRTGQLTTGTGLGWGPIIGSRLVPSTTLDEAVAHMGVPDLVKVDTEGHEVQVLEGGPGLIGERRSVLLIEVHDQLNEAPIRRLLDGWRVERIGHDYLPGEPDHFYLRCEP
jgi:FkbM family methyltransferase